MGYVYLLESSLGNELTYKIGFTRDVEKRKKQLDTGNPEFTTIIKVFRTHWNEKLEASLHRAYSSRKIKGEWFKLLSEDVDSFLTKCENVEKTFNYLKEHNPFFH